MRNHSMSDNMKMMVSINYCVCDDGHWLAEMTHRGRAIMFFIGTSLGDITDQTHKFYEEMDFSLGNWYYQDMIL